MISISGIQYQKELETLPLFNKSQAGMLIDKKGRNLDQKIAQLVRKGYFISLKKGLYTSEAYSAKTNKEFFTEYIANMLRSPSYISCEYILSKSGYIPESVYSVTSIAAKGSRMYVNVFGNFIYQNLKPDLFIGYHTVFWGDKHIYLASPVKALFDFLYLKKLRYPKQELTHDLRINWENFSSENMQEFDQYVGISQSKKMASISKMITSYVH